MDIVAHALWAAAGGTVLRRKALIDRRTFWWMVALAVAPDVVPMLPVIAYAAVSPRTLGFVWAYVMATPSAEPSLPPLVAEITHHLHCTMHSVVVLTVVTALGWVARRRFPLVLLGWWLHVLIDVPTHSADYYGVPLFYPLTYRSFDGVAWTEPWLLAANYALLALVLIWLYRSAKRS